MPLFRGPFTGATTTAAGTSGLVPAPESGLPTRILHADASFSNPAIFPTFKNTNDKVIGSFILAGSGTTAIQNLTISSARTRLFALIYAPSDGNIDTLLTRTGNAPSPAFNVHVALWKVGSDGLPSDYIIGTNFTSGTSATTDISGSVSSTAIKRGFLYISVTPDAITNSGALTALNSITGNIFYRNIFGSDNLSSTQPITPYYIATTYNQTTHETFLYANTTAPNAGFYYV